LHPRLCRREERCRTEIDSLVLIELVFLTGFKAKRRMPLQRRNLGRQRASMEKGGYALLPFRPIY
jgi:hypothetical protein